MKATGPPIRNPESIDFPSSDHNISSQRRVQPSRSQSPNERKSVHRSRHIDDRRAIKPEPNIPRAMACLIIGGAIVIFLTDQIWGLFFGFWYVFFLEGSNLSQGGAENMAVATADILLIPALVVLWLALSYFLYQLMPRGDKT